MMVCPMGLLILVSSKMGWLGLSSSMSTRVGWASEVAMWKLKAELSFTMPWFGESR